MKSIIFAAISAMLLFSCNSGPTKQETKEEVDTILGPKDMIKADTIQSDTIRPKLPKLIYFRQTECLHSCLNESIIRKELKNDTLILEFTVMRDCGTKYDGNIEIKNNTFNLDLKLLPSRIIEHKNGKIDSVFSSQECYCMYNIQVKVFPVKQLPKKILVDNRAPDAPMKMPGKVDYIDTTYTLPQLLYFKQTECVQSEDVERVVKKELRGDTLMVELITRQDCKTKYTAAITTVGNNKLDVILRKRQEDRQIIKNANGSMDTIKETVQCYGMYNFSMKIRPIKQIPEEILVEGKHLNKSMK